MFFASEAIAKEKLAQAECFEKMIFRRATQFPVQFNCVELPLANAMVAVIFETSNESLNSKMQAMSLDESNALELSLKYKEEGNFYIRHKRYYMALNMYIQGRSIAPSQSDVLATFYNNISAALYFLGVYQQSLDFALAALGINSLYGKARKRAAECALVMGRFQLCQEIGEKLLEQNQYTIEAGSMLVKARLGADEAAIAVNNDPQLKRLCEVLHERGVKFFGTRNFRNITELMLKPIGVRPLVHLAKDNVRLVWPIAFFFNDIQIYHFEHHVVETTRLKDVLRKIISDRTIPSAIKLILRKCNVYWSYSAVEVNIRKVDINKSIKHILNQEGVELRHCFLDFIVSKNALEK